MSKGVAEVIGFVITVLLVVVAIGVVLAFGLPLLDQAKETGILNEARQNMESIDSLIRQAAAEGTGSLKTAQISVTDGLYRVDSDLNSFDFSVDLKSSAIPHGTLQRTGTLLTLVGGPATASQNATNLILENELVEVVFGRIGNETSFDGINTSTIVNTIRSKASPTTTIRPTNIGIKVSAIANTSWGLGYSKLAFQTSSLPRVGVLAHVMSNTTGVEYEVLYTLRGSSDFLIVEVRNASQNQTTLTYGYRLGANSSDTLRLGNVSETVFVPKGTETYSDLRPINVSSSACTSGGSGNCTYFTSAGAGSLPLQFDGTQGNATSVAQINSSDSSWASFGNNIAGETGSNKFVRQNFTLPGSSRLNWVWVEGEFHSYSPGRNGAVLRVWNYSNSSWINVARNTTVAMSSTSTNYTFNISGANITDLIGNSNMTIQYLMGMEGDGDNITYVNRSVLNNANFTDPIGNATTNAGNGTSGWANWTAVCSPVSLVCTAAWGPDAPPFISTDLWGNVSSRKTVGGVSNISAGFNQSFYVSSSMTQGNGLLNVSLDFNVTAFSTSSLDKNNSRLEVGLRYPDGTYSILNTSNTLPLAVTSSQWNVNVSISNFTQTGTYVIVLNTTCNLLAFGGARCLVQWDNVQLSFTSQSAALVVNSTRVGVNYVRTPPSTNPAPACYTRQNISQLFACSYDEAEFSPSKASGVVYSGDTDDFVSLCVDESNSEYMFNVTGARAFKSIVPLAQATCGAVGNQTRIIENLGFPSTPFGSYELRGGPTLQMSLQYDRIILNGTDRFGPGAHKICFEKTGRQGNNAIVSVTSC